MKQISWLRCSSFPVAPLSLTTALRLMIMATLAKIRSGCIDRHSHQGTSYRSLLTHLLNKRRQLEIF